MTRYKYPVTRVDFCVHERTLLEFHSTKTGKAEKVLIHVAQSPTVELSFWRVGHSTFLLLAIDRALASVGANLVCFNSKTDAFDHREDIEFCKSDYEVNEVLGGRGLSLTKQTIARRVWDYIRERDY